MKKIILAFGILPLMFISCEKEEITRTIVATATIEGGADTKVSYTADGNALKVNWDNDDTFQASTTNGASDMTFTKTDGNNTFTTTSISDFTDKILYAYYAGSNVTRSAKTQGKTTTITNTINFAGQDGSIGNLKNYELMTSSATVSNDAVDFSFSHECAILKVTVNATDATTSAITLRFLCAQVASGITTNGGITSGSAVVYNDGAAKKPTTESANYVDFTSASISFPAGESTVYFVVPPISFTSALKYTPNQISGKTIILNNTKTIAAGNVYRVSVNI